jgi:Protein of unknown function (DUF3352)
MPGVRIARVALVAALAFALTGCGADEKAGTSGGAEIVPASVPAFISIDSDLNSSQWQTVDDLLRKFPGRAQLLAAIRSSLSDSGFDYEQDVKPALGEEIDVVWLDFESGGENVVGLTKPKDEAAFKRLLEKGNREDPDDALLIGEVEGWTVLADSRAKIERFREAVGLPDKLADDGMFTDAMSELPEDALVKAYAKGENLTRLVQQAFQEFQGTGTLPSRLPFPFAQRPEFVTLALAAEGDGLRLAGATRAETESKTKATVFSSKLIEDVPGDAIAFLTFRGNDSFATQARSSPTYRRSLRRFQQELGVPLDKLLELFDSEVALYVRPGTPFPEITFLIPVESDEPAEEAPFRSIDQLMKALTRSTTAQPCHAPTVEDGVTVACVRVGKVAIRYAGFDEKVVVTTGQSPVAELRSKGEKLPDAESFKQAKAAADLPDETAGFLWVDVAKAVPMLLGYAEAADEPIPPAVRANLEPLRSLVIWGDSEGRTTSFSAFLGID